MKAVIDSVLPTFTGITLKQNFEEYLKTCILFNSEKVVSMQSGLHV